MWAPSTWLTKQGRSIDHLQPGSLSWGGSFLGAGETLCPRGAWALTLVLVNLNPHHLKVTQEGEGFLSRPCPQPLHPLQTQHRGQGGGRKNLTHMQRFQYNLYYLIYIFFLTLFAHFCHAFKMSQRPK